MRRKIIMICLSFIMMLSVSTTPIYAANGTSVSGDGYKIFFSISEKLVSGSITGTYANGACVKIEARFRNVMGQVSNILIRYGYPYTSYSLNEVPKLNGYDAYQWHSGKTIGYPTSLTYGVSTSYCYL